MLCDYIKEGVFILSKQQRIHFTWKKIWPAGGAIWYICSFVLHVTKSALEGLEKKKKGSNICGKGEFKIFPFFKLHSNNKYLRQRYKICSRWIKTNILIATSSKFLDKNDINLMTLDFWKHITTTLPRGVKKSWQHHS